MKKLLFITLFLLSLQIFSQATEFKGKVVDNDTSNSINNAQVTIEDTNYNTLTDVNGEFSIFKNIPIGEQIVSITKDDYETKFLIIDVVQGKKIEIQEIKLELTKKAKNKRKKILKELKKKKKEAQREKEKKLKKLKKEAGEKRKKLEKKKKEIRDNSEEDVIITYTPIKTSPVEPVVTISQTQIKYGKILGIEPQEITNVKLYDFIDGWMGVPYLLGGENRDGIDCSSFTQLLYIKVYDEYIERTAEKQFNSKSREKFRSIDYLEEGDLMFFKSKDQDGEDVIGHVGLYLKNGYFVNSTSKRGVDNVKGVQICNINDRYWKKKYVGAARRNKK